jgi:hypothetical protein
MAVYFCALSRAEDEQNMGVEKQCRASIFEGGRLFACLLPPERPALGAPVRWASVQTLNR